MTDKKKHKHYDLILAWANGAEIQFYDHMYDRWTDTESPCWNIDGKYRIKPVVKSKAELLYETIDAALFEEGGGLGRLFAENKSVHKRYNRFVELYEKALAEQEKSC